jgi:hypothetical protein
MFVIECIRQHCPKADILAVPMLTLGLAQYWLIAHTAVPSINNKANRPVQNYFWKTGNFSFVNFGPSLSFVVPCAFINIVHPPAELGHVIVRVANRTDEKSSVSHNFPTGVWFTEIFWLIECDNLLMNAEQTSEGRGARPSSYISVTL